ncbi:MAG: glycosyltransferase family 4 protein [Actinomycetota bacterium]
MRILLACPYAWDAPGGVQVHVGDLARRLRGRGHEVLVLAPARRPFAEPWVRVVGRPLRIPYAGTVAPVCPSAASWRAVRRAMREFAPDVVHAHEPFAPGTAMFATLSATAPVVATFHAYLERATVQRVAAPLLRVIARRIAVAIAVSRAAASFAGRAVSLGYEIVPNGVEVGRFRGAPRRGSAPRIAFVGRLDPQKGFPVLVDAFARLAADRPDLGLVVAGDGADRDAVERLGSTARGRVAMLGAVPNGDLAERVFAEASVFCSPAVGQESFGIVLVEAMAAGLPVVASDIPGYREVVRDGTDGLLVRPADPASLAATLARVLDDPALASRLAGAGRERAEAFSWDAVLPRIEAVYARAVAR